MNHNCQCRKCGYTFDPVGRFVEACPKCKATKWSYSKNETFLTEHADAVEAIVKQFAIPPLVLNRHVSPR
jgi:predicted  nucleic acid-binding Zn-ribbon protein